MDLDCAHECNQALALVHDLLRSGCDDLSSSSGLILDPDYVAHALLDPDLSAQLCLAISSACSSITEPHMLPLAREAVDSISRAASCLRVALGSVAAIQGQNLRAISAYNDNL
jgi:hypothetical protein